MDTIGRGTAILLLVILFLLFPLRYDALSQQKSCTLYVQNETKYFLNQLIQTKQLSMYDYQQYLDRISNSQSIYEIEISCYQKANSFREEQQIVITDFVDVLLVIEESGQMLFHPEDYISIRLKCKDTFTNKLKNMFLPTFPNSETFMAGGFIT